MESRRYFLFSDIEGSTRLWEDVPESMSRALARHDELVRATIQHSSGRVIKGAGDGFLAVFADARSAVGAAVGMQRMLMAEPWPAEAIIRVRVAIHAGSSEERDGDYFGPVLNRTDRLNAIAHAGQIIVSSAAAESLRDQPLCGVVLRDLGWHRLKDLQEPEHVFQVVADELTENFPPLRSLGHPALLHNLPLQTTTLIGRDDELALLRRLIAEARIVTLTGSGGVGKTRLALQAGADLLDGSGDGVWFVELASIESDAMVPAAVAAALGIREEPGRTLSRTIVNALRERRLLLILDNCEHVVEGAALLAQTLAQGCAGVAILATSREPLRLAGEYVFRVPSLAVGEQARDLAGSPAIQLFLDRGVAHAPRGGFTDDQLEIVASLCRRLDGIPLAIELAAARLSALSLPDLASRIDERFELLTSGRRDVLPRHRTLHALIDWSYALLTVPERSFLTRLAVFPDSFAADAAQAVAACGASAVRLLADLAEKNLLQADVGGDVTRYRLLETIRAFALAKLADRGEEEVDAARRAHRDHYLAFAEANESSLWVKDAQVLRRSRERMETEYPNLATALDYSLTDPDATPGLRLVVALRRFWRLRGTAAEAARAASAQLRRGEAKSVGIMRAQALLVLASALSISDPRAAIEPAREALAIVGDSGAARLRADALVTMANAVGQQGNIGEALSLTEAALMIARSADDLLLTATCLNILIFYGRNDEATVTEAINAADALGDPLTTLAVRANIGNQALIHGDIATARAHTQDALGLARQLNFGREVLGIGGQLGWIEHKEGDLAAARTRFAQIARNAVKLGNGLLIAYSLLGCAVLADDPGAAAQLHGATERLFEELGSTPEPFEREQQLTSMRALRADVGPARFETLRSRGRGISVTDALSLLPP